MNATADKAKLIFLAAAELANSGQRKAYLDAECTGEPNLRREVDELLRHFERVGSFMASPAADLSPTGEFTPTLDDARLETVPITERPGTVIGPYKLLEQIGEGGMGLVFVAEQQQPVRRRVALKIIKPGMDSRQVIARFEAERQALAMMDHPNIAKVFDGGTIGSEPRALASGLPPPVAYAPGSDGRPYFVMELVKGTPITEYCDHHRLTTRDRLKLFLDVCSAVQHAHQKGIIHRDIKPSNVLVSHMDVTPVVKVIDFGIAKAVAGVSDPGYKLTDRTIYTAFAQLVGTPLYMSPEQAGLSDQDVDTRSDVYSLGVLLYELLTGTTPFDSETLKKAGYDEMRRIIREDEPPRPSARLSTMEQARLSTIAEQRGLEARHLSQHLRGELDWIVMRALEKDRNRRYESASGFAADVQRYLNDEPVQACPPSKTYRLRKYVRRHKAGLGVAAVVLTLLTVVAVGVGWVVGDRSSRKRQAETIVLNALDAATPGFEQGNPWDRDLVSALRTAEAHLHQGLLSSELQERVEQLQKDVKMLVELERIELEKTQIVNEHYYGGSADAYQQAFEVYGIDVPRLELEEAVRLVQVSAIRKHLSGALYEWALALLNGGTRPDDPEIKQIGAVRHQVDSSPWMQQLREAALSKDSMELERLILAAPIEELPPGSLGMLGMESHGLGAHSRLIEFFRLAQARYPTDFWINHNLAVALTKLQPPRLEEAVGFYRASVAMRPDSPGVWVNLGVGLRGLGRMDEAIAAHRKAIELNPEYALAHTNLGIALEYLGRLDEAIAAHRKAISLKPDYAEAHNNLSVALYDKGMLDQATAECRKATELKPDFAEAHTNLSNILSKKGMLDEAIAEARKAIQLKPDYAEAHNNLSNRLSKKGMLDEAIVELRKAIQLKPDYSEAYFNLSNALRDKGKPEEAIAELRKAIQLKPDYSEAHSNLGALLAHKGMLDAAIAEYRWAIELKPDSAEAHTNLGFALARKGVLDAAIAEHRKAIELKTDLAIAHCNLGLTLQQTGKFVEALKELRRGHELGSKSSSPWPYPSGQWVKKCEGLVELDRKLPAILSGEQQPADIGERLALAELCQMGYKKLYTAALKLYEEAFAADPRLVGEQPSNPRYNAACAAALAGCGQGKDADQTDDEARARLRRQSLDWLRAELTAWSKALQEQPDKTRPSRQQTMQHWQRDPDFNGVRDAQALSKLPPEEQEAWRNLWADVAKLLERAK